MKYLSTQEEKQHTNRKRDKGTAIMRIPNPFLFDGIFFFSFSLFIGMSFSLSAFLDAVNLNCKKE